MAGISKKGDAYYCTFRFGGKRFYFTVGKVTESQAQAKATEVDETLSLVARGKLQVPAETSFLDFVAHGGKVPVFSVTADTVTASQVFEKYLLIQANGTIEQHSLATIRTHLNQVEEILSERFKVQSLTLNHLQGHVDRRRKSHISPATIKKELASFRACWNWAVAAGLLKGTFPDRGLRFPKGEEKEPFRGFAEIQAIIKSEQPDDARQNSLWESLYLTRREMEELLEHVRNHGTLPWVYPIVAFAAYTGARRSEMLRVQLTDVDFKAGIVKIREKKRVKGKNSTRTAPLAPKLKAILREWLEIRPESPFLFCQSNHVTHSKTQRDAPTEITRNEAHDHIKRSLAGSKWEVLRGYHVLRHSWISAMASKGIDQRIIDEAVGHQSEEQRKRYRHLYPQVMKEAINKVFG